ncbi:MAG: glycosyl hydrolase-related protein, partial [Planctomycetota bacterium]|nr:glycosyl hydrolase-related protein [Planctomycetota bacterium]
CLKPADGDTSDGFILRLWEVAGRSEPISIGLRGYSKAILTDLLERDCKELKIIDGKVIVKMNPNGFCALRLLP